MNPKTMQDSLWRRGLLGALAAPVILALGLAAAGCGSPTDSRSSTPEPEPKPPADTTSLIPSQGDPAVLDIGAWNVEWFGSPDFDPADDSLQLARVGAVLADADVDIWGLEEVVLASQWEALLASLPAYRGVLVSDPEVAGGAASYYAKEQKPALLYRADVARLVAARVALPEHDHFFAGRPPLEVELDVTLNGVTERLVVLVVHMKAGAGADDRDRRGAAAGVLKAYLDATYPDRKVMVIGDFNDDVDTSINAGSPTPYAAFIADSAAWSFPTAELSEARISSMTRYPDLVDHHLYSNEMRAGYVAGSARVVRLDEWLDRYEDTTSDHFPVLTRYAPGSQPGS